jgi:hypothetical protein
MVWGWQVWIFVRASDLTKSISCLILGFLAAAAHLFASLVSFICSHILRGYVMGGLTLQGTL